MRLNIIKPRHITSSVDLKNQIDRLAELKEVQEELLKENIKSISHSLQPGNLLKRVIHKFDDDGKLSNNTLKASLSLGTNFLLDKIILGKGFGIKSYFLNIALKKAASFLISLKKSSTTER